MAQFPYINGDLFEERLPFPSMRTLLLTTARLGLPFALELIIDQYKVTTDKRSGITNEPNRADDPEQIVKLIGQVIRVRG